MPNGRPCDHPYTDIVLHGMKVFGSPIDDLVRQIAERGTVSHRYAVSDLVAEHEPRFHNKKANPAYVESQLRLLLAEISGE